MDVPVTMVPLTGVDLTSTLKSLSFMAGDPTTAQHPGRFERATVTPEGVGTIVVTWRADDLEARVETHGDGGDWLLTRAPELLGCRDDVAGFSPTTAPLSQLWRRFRGDRIPRTGTLWHDLAWFIVQQRVSGRAAAQQWRRLITDLGTPAPGNVSLTAPPEPQTVASLGHSDFHRYGIERQRADTLRRAACEAPRLNSLIDAPVVEALPVLCSIRGVGPWTSSCLATQTWGDPDTVIVGDHGIPTVVAWVLAQEPRADDQRLVELTAPYRPHRTRVIRLALAHGGPPRRHHRAQLTDIRSL